MKPKGKPGRSSQLRARPNATTSSLMAVSSNPAQDESLLAVELRAADQEPSDAERELIAIVMKQLPPFMAQPRIMILLMPPKHPVELDAQNVANQSGEPVAIADMEGKLLAFRAPQRH